MTTEAPTPKTAITLCGSLRKASINEPLRRHMSKKLREAGVEVTDLDLREFEMPVFNQDIEDAGNTPEAAKRLAEMFRTYDIVLIISPEYNGGVTPLVANLISWVSRQKPNPFKHAIFGIGGLSDGKYATIFGLSHLRDSLSLGPSSSRRCSASALTQMCSMPTATPTRATSSGRWARWCAS